jgi:hypothetical protein
LIWPVLLWGMAGRAKYTGGFYRQITLTACA